MLAAAFAVLAVGSENLTLAFQFGFVGSLAFGLLAVRAVEDDRLWLPPVLLTCALMCSDIGLSMVVACALVALVLRRRAAAAAAALPPALIFLVWYVAIGHSGAQAIGLLSVGGLLSYIWTGLTASMGGFVDLSQHVGAVLISVIAATAVVRRNVPAALAVTTVVFYALAGLGRLSLGVSEAASSRYSYITVALLLPLIGQLITILMRNGDVRPIVISGLVLLVGVNAVVLQADGDVTATAYNVFRGQIQAAAYLIHRGERFSGQSTISSNAGPLGMPSVATLTAWLKRGQFPVPTEVAESTLRAERAIMGVFTSQKRGYPDNLTFTAPNAPTCVRTRVVTIHLDGSGSLRLPTVYKARRDQLGV